MEMKAIINASIYDYESYRKDYYILYDEEVIEVGPMSSYKGWDIETLDAKGAMIMPSLVNAHSHIYSTLARGLALPFSPNDFEELLEQLWWRIDRQLSKEDVYYSGIVHGVESMKNGITTFIDHHASGEIKGSLETLKEAICRELDLRGVFCFETSDRFDIDECVSENEEFLLAYHQDDCGALFGLHASFTLSDTSLKRIHQTSKWPIHIHVAESELDEERCRKRYGLSVVERLDSHGLLTPYSLLAHCSHISEKDAQIIKERGCRIVVNITSNMNNGQGMPDLQMFHKYEIPVLIGNDGISTSISSEWLALYYGMHHEYKSPVGYSLEQIKESIINSYTYASKILGCKLGRLEMGYAADLMLLPYKPGTPIESANAFSHIFFGLANAFKPSHVWCKGNQVVSNYQASAYLEEQCLKGQNNAKALWERVNNDGE